MSSAFVVGGDIGAEGAAVVASLAQDFGPVLEQFDVGRGLDEPVRFFGAPAILPGQIVIEPGFGAGGEAEPLEAVLVEPCVMGSGLPVDVIEIGVVTFEATGNGGVAGAIGRGDASDIVEGLIALDPARLSLIEQRLLALELRGRVEEPLAPADEIVAARERAGDSANQFG